MRKKTNLSLPLKYLFSTGLKIRRVLPSKRSKVFGNKSSHSLINHIYVINLKRQPKRWKEIEAELQQISDISGSKLNYLTERYNAIDAKEFLNDPIASDDLDPIYTLGDQLYVEPQPLILPTEWDLNFKIRMSRPEIAVAYSHIELWKRIASGNNEYTMILEDDIWFKPAFNRELNKVWKEIKENDQSKFDILYLSFEEVKNGAPKTFISSKIFCPVRGLWNLSGYVVSKQGAEKLLKLLPCKGPIDLWINHKFKSLNVLASYRSIISQRPDLSSTNSYSILPALTKIGAITSEGAALFNNRPLEVPVFAFGSNDSGLTSLAIALSMLGYRCLSDLETIPNSELNSILTGKNKLLFNAYVNINILKGKLFDLIKFYPNAKFIFTLNENECLDEVYLELIKILDKNKFVILNSKAPNKWQIICQLLRTVPPDCRFPELIDKGNRKLKSQNNISEIQKLDKLKHDFSPWVMEIDRQWNGIDIICDENSLSNRYVMIKEDFKTFNSQFWTARNDTFTDNLALFREENLVFDLKHGLALTLKKHNLGVRKYSAGAMTSKHQYLYGRFEVVLKASNVPGVITGFFLHRDSPRQEIDIEIAGKNTSRLLTNVFYNPGDEGAKFDYGYRGTPTYIDLGFDASESFHKYAIEWDESEIRWFVDDHLVHRRNQWNPTPIPHLPMAIHLNIWPCRSKEFAGILINKLLPTTTFLKKISINAQKL
ncbi:family 16 glycosylhydrolase [Flavobacterium sp. YJ01]|uniref:family 16 glycosylhydrolase n=1 Tax=Flavobacterium sp. YJ01 TaxID=3031997 RepID=UPI0023E35F0A|nr:family 16 glycosylhydrolase [Flavobacterium sp. YJ01]WET03910.1 family 16 glycosylhydrolase [Flavobacterium sp. YJ01]